MNYLVHLTAEERAQLRALLRAGQAPTRKLTHARVLLKADQNARGLHDQCIAEALEINPRTVLRTRQRYVLDGLDAALDHLRPQRFKPKKLDERAEAQLIALACSGVPESLGHTVWTLRLLADQMVELGYVDAISHETVRTYLKKNILKPHLHEQFVIPPEYNGAFVAAMEDVLDLYARDYDPFLPVVCFDERPCHLISDVHERLPGAPGRLARYDYLYTRHGTINLFGMAEPKIGRVDFEVTERHTKLDFAFAMKRLVDGMYPQARRVLVVLDNLATHTKGALYEAFEPEEACRIARKLEFHFTPKHGSWLNAIELEFAALTRQALDHRIGTSEELERVIQIYQTLRNEQGRPIDWAFTSESARSKLTRLYPKQLTNQS